MKKKYSAKDLEKCVLPPPCIYRSPLFNYNPDIRPTEEKIAEYQHRMELIRTIATSINVIATICVLLKVFKVI